jgi:hypothetical protein
MGDANCDDAIELIRTAGGMDVLSLTVLRGFCPFEECTSNEEFYNLDPAVCACTPLSDISYEGTLIEVPET